ncbi:PAS domain S-box protein [Flaviramulus sp. BrNp1-15]|uniref:PAS domain S-box protein n=1 Tax=Flaviramulus sp. BrNp1-15 TaxID=2916754 RepID=UPI001EE89ECC|nr:PAS domain S-box protein [Flaviramulus sp. BrNp1-15]ULC58052.1 PAS domain S-box protein [Flaviramulus sp. BrNp1-15]
MSASDIKLLKELKETYGFSNAFMESQLDGFLIISTLGKIIAVNSKLCKITGFKEKELLNSEIPYLFWPPELHEAFSTGLQKMLNADIKAENETIHMRKNGERFPVLVFVASIKNNNDEVIAHLGLIKELTDDKKDVAFEKSKNQGIFSVLNYRKKYLDLILEKKLSSQLDITLNSISDGIISLDNNWCYTYVNDKAGALLGRAPNSLIGKNIWEVFPDGVNLPFYKAYHKAVETQQIQDFQEYYEPLDKWFENRVYPYTDGLTIYFSDITEKKEANQLITQKEQELNIIYKTLTQPIFILKVEKGFKYKFISVSDSYLNLFDTTREDIIDKYVSDVIPEPILSFILEKHKEVIKSKKPIQWEENRPYKPGIETAIITISPLFDENNECTHLVGIVYDITERKKAEKEVEIIQQKLQAAIRIGKIGYWSWDIINDKMFWSDLMYEIYDVDKNMPLKHDSVLSMVHPEDKDYYKKLTKDRIENKNSDPFEYRILWRDNTVKYVMVQTEIIEDESGNAIKFQGTVIDITELKEAEEQIIKSEKYLDNIINNIGDPVFVKNDQSEFVLVNDAFCEIFRLSKDDIIGKTLSTEVPEEETNLFLSIDKQVLSTGIENINEEKLTVRDGETLLISTKKTRYIDYNGNKFIIGVIRDVTERKKAEERLLESEYNLRQSQVVANIGSYSLDINSMTWKTSDVLDKIFGVNKSFVKNVENWIKIIHPEERDEIRSYFENNILKNHEKFDKEYRILKLDNKNEVWVHGFGELVLDDEGKPIKMIGTIQDITERKKAELDLKLAKEFTDKLMMSMQEGLIIVNLEGKIIMVNDSTCKILGYSNKELVGLNLPYPFIKQEDFEDIVRTNQLIAKGEAPSFQFEFIRKNGEKFLATFLTGNIKDNRGEVIALFGTMKDISKEVEVKKTLEENAIKSNLKKNVILELANLVGKDFKTSIKKITKLAAKTLNVERVSIWSFNADKSAIKCERLYTLKSNLHSNGLVLKKTDNPKYFKALEKHQTILINDAQKNSVTKQFSEDYLIPQNIKSLMDVFVNSTNGYYGIICFEHVGETIRNWTADEQEFATSIANIVSLMVESTERKIIESELKSEKEFSEKLITSLHEGLSVVNLEGKHIQVNAALCEMTGFSEEELIGIKAPFPYWPPEEYDNIYKSFNSPIESLGINKEFTLMRKNGERFPVSLCDSTIKDKNGKIIAYFSTITDITDRVKAENILKENIKIADQRKNIIIELASLIGEDFNSSLRKIVTTSAKALNTELVTIWEFKKDKTELLSKLFYNTLDNKFDEEGLIIKKEDFPNYFEAFKEKNSLNIPDVVNNSITKAFAKQYYIPYNISSRIDVLVYGRNDHYGIISFESTTPKRVFTNEEESFVTSIASMVSLMVESSERKLAENKIAKANEKLIEANKELNELRDQLEQENVYLRNELDLVFNYEEMVYGSTEFSNVLTEVEKVSPTNATVLLLGESGTGKELIARAIHNTSLRNNKPLIKVNCSAIPRELIESELFGHKKGSFTGAFSDKIGKFELADGGTLFLDEIGELPIDMQPKILRFLQEGEIEVVGGTGLKKLNVRVIAATNRNLKEEIAKKQFREDLYFRLNVFPIEIPPLRNRKDDIPLLVEHFVDKFNKAYDKHIKYIPDDSMNQLKTYDWPGNIRELENLIERALILSNGDTLVIPGFESTMQKEKQQPAVSNNVSLDVIQRNHILQILEQCNWKISGPSGAAILLDLKPSTLRDKMSKLGIKKSAKK